MSRGVIDSLNDYVNQKLIDIKTAELIREFYLAYIKEAKESSTHSQSPEKLFNQLLELIKQNILDPYQFEVFHSAIRQPFDYYQFGLDFIRLLINFSNSKIVGADQIQLIRKQLNNGENVILFANHQTEPDPQIISLMIESIDSKLASEIIYVAGHRVTQDPLAIPMSIGTNLLCIYSKKHMEFPPEKKGDKITHNQTTMKAMGELLGKGGVCIYVAPSGGRDRINNDGIVNMSPFDPQSVELFYLMGKKAKNTHFYPLALQTYWLMPPPILVEKELGERRIPNYMPVKIGFGSEIDMEAIDVQHIDKSVKRKIRAESIWNQVNQIYQTFQ
ncbi:MAG: 1-acyl-sn-glycerol-3-phosphate acyltransferase [Parachlamydiaceae bacterium]|nr:1-acyl-sn-glycerol-3-phosphate acyltransferase [Parachlamydiaceae bacterium]